MELTVNNKFNPGSRVYFLHNCVVLSREVREVVITVENDNDNTLQYKTSVVYKLADDWYSFGKVPEHCLFKSHQEAKAHMGDNRYDLGL